MLFAYLDAGSGSLIIQMLVGGLAGIVTMVRYRLSRRSASPADGEIAAEADTEDLAPH